MPLMRPEVQKILRAAGLGTEEKSSSQDSPLAQRLDAAGLSLDDTIDTLASIINSTGNESLKLNAVRDVLKMHGALKETSPAPPSFTIIIQDTSEAPTSGLPSGVNPILLPRQLLSKAS